MESIRNRNEVKSSEKPDQKDIFMFVNPLSGSREGEAYTDLPTDLYEFTMDDGTQTRLTITNLLEKEAVKTTIKDIEKTVQTKLEDSEKQLSSVIILLCGGDGTFMNMAQELLT